VFDLGSSSQRPIHDAAVLGNDNDWASCVGAVACVAFSSASAGCLRNAHDEKPRFTTKDKIEDSEEKKRHQAVYDR
jgi:hypothetical protein